MRRLALVALLVIGACSKKQDASSSSCEVAAKSAVEAMVKLARDRLASSQMPPEVRAKMEERTKKLDELRPRLIALITNRCVDDKWPAAVVDCYRQSANIDAMRACRGKLPKEQEETLVREELKLVSGEMGPPGFGRETGSGMDPGGPVRIMPTREQMEQRLAAIEKLVTEAQASVAAAKTDADRTAAQEKLDKLMRNAERLKQQLAHADAMQAGSAAAGSGRAVSGSGSGS